MAGQAVQQLTNALRRLIKTLSVALPKPEPGYQFCLCQAGDKWSVARSQTNGRVAGSHPFLMALPVQQGPGIQIQRVTTALTWQTTHRPLMQSVECVAGTFIEALKKSTQS